MSSLRGILPPKLLSTEAVCFVSLTLSENLKGGGSPLLQFTFTPS